MKNFLKFVIMLHLTLLFKCAKGQPDPVEGQPQWNITAPRPVVQTRFGRRAMLTCSLTPPNAPETEYYWRKGDGTRIATNREIVVDSERFYARKSSTRYSLQIRPALPFHNGTYFCGFTHNGETGEAQVDLLVEVPDAIRNAPLSIRANRRDYSTRIDSSLGLILSCRYSPPFAQDVQLYWRKEGGQRLTSGETALVEPGRVSAQILTSRSDYKLRVRELRRSDTGTYVCGIERNGTVREDSAQFTVLEPPSISREDSSPTITTASRGSDVEITCVATGSPDPRITWNAVTHYVSPDSNFGQQRIVEVGQGPVLSLTNVQLSDISYYRCNADNDIPSPASKVFFLNVTDSPIISVQTPPNVQPGSPAVLTCDVTFNPIGQASWRFEGQVMTNSSNHLILTNFTSQGITLTLRIRTLSPSDFGLYICQATNSFGTDQDTVSLSVNGVSRGKRDSS